MLNYILVAGVAFVVLMTLFTQAKILDEAPEIGEYYDEKIKNVIKKFGKAVKNHYSR